MEIMSPSTQPESIMYDTYTVPLLTRSRWSSRQPSPATPRAPSATTAPCCGSPRVIQREEAAISRPSPRRF
eukprot:5740030-Pleurochrysis_carterae.AAC.2